MKGSLPIVIGDLNEDFHDYENDGIKLLTTPCNLVNIFQSIIGSTPSSRNNNRKVFHILIHPHIFNFVNRLGTLYNTSRFPSDHIPFFIDLKRNLFISKLSSLLPSPLRILKSTNKASLQKYVKDTLSHLNHHQTPSRRRWLQNLIESQWFTQKSQQKLEKIDKTVMDARLRIKKIWYPPQPHSRV